MAYQKFEIPEGKQQEQLRNITIREAKKAQSGDWQIKIEIPDFSTNLGNYYETSFCKQIEGFVPADEINASYKIMVKRDKLRSDKDGNPKSGDYDDHYWHFVNWSSRQKSQDADATYTSVTPNSPSVTPTTPATTNNQKPSVQQSDDFRIQDRQARARNSREAIAKDIIVAAISKVDSITPTKAIVLMNMVGIGADLIEGKVQLNEALKNIEKSTNDLHAVIEEVLSDDAMKQV